ncbi:MAG: hypothetical protein ACRDZ8_20765 [Acidimicrobiales bacterium]
MKSPTTAKQRATAVDDTGATAPSTLNGVEWNGVEWNSPAPSPYGVEWN